MNPKRTALLILTLVAILSLTGWTGAQAEPTEPGLITVSGEAEVRVVPDEVVLTLGIETRDKDLTRAKDQNDDRVKAVLTLIQGYGVKPQHIQTDHISIEPRYEHNYNQETFIGYFVRKTVVVTLKDISKFEELLTGVLEAGANYVHGIQFRTTELRKYRDEARALAIQAAREKAVAMASGLDQQIGRPRTIRENHSGWWSGYNAWWGRPWGASSMTQNVVQEIGNGSFTGSDGLAPGLITVNAGVTVTFELK
jgi:hypothetical protein